MSDARTTAARGRGALSRMLGIAMLLVGAVAATIAQASTVLIADTTLVSGTETAVFSFNAPGPGTVSVQLTNLDWPQALSSLSFMATDASHVLSSWAVPGSTASQWFAVGSSGRYFADVTATAAGSLDLGAYSLYIDFTPTGAPVPLPSSGALLMGAIVGLVALARRSRSTTGLLAL